MSEKSVLLDRFARDGEERILLGRVLDRLEASQRKNCVTCTGFLNPREREVVGRLLAAVGKRDGFVFHGGY